MMLGAWRKPCCSPSNGEVGDGHALGPERVDDHLRLVRRHDLVLQPLQHDEGRSKPSRWWMGERAT